jgi:hypothetical protein
MRKLCGIALAIALAPAGLRAGEAECRTDYPDLRVSPSTSPTSPFAGTRGSTLTFTISVKSTDGRGCPAATFKVGPAHLKAGTNISINPPEVKLEPGEEKSVTLTYKPALDVSSSQIYLNAYRGEAVPANWAGGSVVYFVLH